jgi:hypothetical protein
LKRSAKKAAPRSASKRAEGTPSPAVRRRRKMPKNHGDLGVGDLRPQPHGGALRNGGPKKGGPGRPRNEARELSLAGYFENLPRLIRIAAGIEMRKALNSEGQVVEVQPTFEESIEAMKELGNRGIGSKVELETPTNPLNVTIAVGPAVAEEMGAGCGSGCCNPG